MLFKVRASPLMEDNIIIDTKAVGADAEVVPPIPNKEIAKQKVKPTGPLWLH